MGRVEGGDEEFEGVVGVLWVGDAVGRGVMPGAEDGGVEGECEVGYGVRGVVECEAGDEGWWWHCVVC